MGRNFVIFTTNIHEGYIFLINHTYLLIFSDEFIYFALNSINQNSVIFHKNLYFVLLYHLNYNHNFYCTLHYSSHFYWINNFPIPYLNNYIFLLEFL